MTRLGHIIQQRLERLDKIRAQGIDPYPPTCHRTHTVKQAAVFFERQEKDADVLPDQVSLAGRIVASRSMGKTAFIDLRDGSVKIQVYFRGDSLGEEKYQRLKDFDIGDIIEVSGKLFRTHSGEITIDVSDFTMLCKSLQPLPEKWHGLTEVEKRYRQRYLDLISSEGVRDIFQVRTRIIAAMRKFLDERGFLEVETPVLQPTASGALAQPFATHHQALDEELYLRIALELYLKRLVIGGFDKVYEIGRVFRNEGISTKHNPEFTMMESYEAYADCQDVMHMVEEMVCYIAQEVLGQAQVEFTGTILDFSPPWQRLPLRQAIEERCGIDFESYPDADSLGERMRQAGMEVDPSKGRGRLIDELIATSVEPNLIQPTFLLDYPVEMSPLAKRKPGSGQLVERFEAFAGRMEIANAFTELNDPVEQRERFRQQQRGEEIPDEDFLQALEYGMPPTGGLGMGIDRLVMLLTNQQSIREVILFPQLRAK
jgi:lysyl-tRNA synthetase class 2